MFEKRTFVEADANNISVSLGNTYTIELSREFHLESLFIELRGTLAVSSPAVNAANGHWDLIKRVELHIPNGDNTKIVDVKGATLMRMALNLRGTLGLQTLKSINTNGNFLYYFPIFCAQPQIQDPVGSRFLLPCPSYSAKPRLVITMAAGASDCGTGLTYSGMTLSVHSQRRFVTRAVEPVRWSLIEREVAIASTGRARAAIELGGSLMGILITGYNSGRTAIQAPAGWNTLQSLEVSRTPVRQWLLDQAYLENSFSIFDLAGSYGIGAPESVQYLDFVTDKSGEVVDDLGSVLPTEPTRAAGNEIAYVFDNATANLNLSLTEYRIAESDAFLAKLKRRELNPAAAA